MLVEVNRSSLPARLERARQELVRAVRQVHDDAVGASHLRDDFRRVADVRPDIGGLVELDILLQEPDRSFIDVDGFDAR